MNGPDMSHRRAQGMLCAHGAYPAECLACFRFEVIAVRAELAATQARELRLRSLVGEFIDNIRTTPHMGGEVSNPSIRDRKAMCELLPRAFAALAEKPS